MHEMSKNTAISVRISDEMDEQIATIAQLRGRTKSWVINEALQGYIESEKQFVEAVQVGLRDIDAGRVVPHDAVMRELGDIIAAARKHQISKP